MWWPVAEEQLKELREMAFSFKRGSQIYKKLASIKLRPPISATKILWLPHNRYMYILSPKQAKNCIEISLFEQNKHTTCISFVTPYILWPLFFFPKNYEPPVYLGPPFWRKCQPPNVWCSGLQTTDQVTRGKGLSCCPEDACQKSFQRFSALTKNVMVGKHVLYSLDSN